MASTESFPVATRQASQTIAGFPTEVRDKRLDQRTRANCDLGQILLQFFQDKTVVLVNQGKIGKMIQISPPTTSRRRTTQRRDPFGDDEEQEQHSASDQTIHDSLNGAFLPPPDASSAITTLFGTSKTEELRQAEQLYASQIAAILFAKSRQPMSDDDAHVTSATGLGETKPVVVALGLKPAFLEGKTAEPGQALDSDSMQEQRGRFRAVMDLVTTAI